MSTEARQPLAEAVELLTAFRDFAASGAKFYYPLGSLQRLDEVLAALSSIQGVNSDQSGGEALHNLIELARPFMRDEAQQLGLREAEAALAATPQPAEPGAVERIEVVSYETGFAEDADPLWRIVIDGYCADFPTETAANNFRSAILNLTAQADADTRRIADEVTVPSADDLDKIGATGRRPVIGKHRAANLAHIRETIEALDAAGMREAADTLMWSVWFRVLDRQREDFLVGDANERAQTADARAEALSAEVERLKGAAPEAKKHADELDRWALYADVRRLNTVMTDAAAFLRRLLTDAQPSRAEGE